MSLDVYHVDLSALSANERASVMECIEHNSFNGLHLYSDFKSGIFEVNKGFDIKQLNLPVACHVTLRQ
nr:MAG TPA: hypothetical protein [Caudoviricetes sp.]